MTSIQLREALPGLAAGLTLNIVAMIEYSAIAGAIGSGGVGYLAVTTFIDSFAWVWGLADDGVATERNRAGCESHKRTSR